MVTPKASLLLDVVKHLQAAVDARNERLDIVVPARTDALIISEEESLYRAKMFHEIRVDIVFIEALPDKVAMLLAIKAVDGPICASIIEGGKPENMSAADLAALGFCQVAYPWMLVAAKLKSIRETLENIKARMTKGAPPKFSAMMKCATVLDLTSIGNWNI